MIKGIPALVVLYAALDLLAQALRPKKPAAQI
jgi:hypothetical protein